MTRASPRTTEPRGLVRALVRRGSRDDKAPPVVRKHGQPADPTTCPGCGAVFTRKSWRRGPRAPRRPLLARAAIALCPACRQTRRGVSFGRILLRGSFVPAHIDEIRRRVRNVAERAAFTQPERRVVALRRRGAEVEVLTTSEKLAHRIVHELKKAFHGRASYGWTEPDGRLFAVWERDEREATP